MVELQQQRRKEEIWQDSRLQPGLRWLGCRLVRGGAAAAGQRLRTAESIWMAPRKAAAEGAQQQQQLLGGGQRHRIACVQQLCHKMCKEKGC